MEFQNLLGVTSHEAMRFFYSGLRETEVGRTLPDFEIQYVASMLGHYAQFSIAAPTHHPTPPANLTQVFDQFILTNAFHEDVELLQLAASQCLFVLGFFSTQMSSRHNLRWFETYGRGYYMRASYLSTERAQQKLFFRMSKDFAPCVAACQEFQKNLRDARFLLQ